MVNTRVVTNVDGWPDAFTHNLTKNQIPILCHARGRCDKNLTKYFNVLLTPQPTSTPGGVKIALPVQFYRQAKNCRQSGQVLTDPSSELGPYVLLPISIMKLYGT